ncbi:MAG: deoxyribodipyrimidine photo-lyase [Zestosphaera sp.]
MSSLYIFTRDLRVEDNRALWEACKKSDKIVTAYILDFEELKERGIEYEDPRFSFLIEALNEINNYTKLRVFIGKPDIILSYLLDKYGFDKVFMSHPHTETEREKKRRVESVCERHGVKLITVKDNVLTDYTQIRSGVNFTSFYREWRKRVDDSIVDLPPTEKFAEVDEPSLEEVINKNKWRVTNKSSWSLSDLKMRLQKFDFVRYAYMKDLPGVDGTSKLSPYISHGIISVRIVYLRAREYSEEFVRQLAWREYYYYLMEKHPWMRRLELKPYMRNLKWGDDEELFRAFTEGKTGYPIVDAGIKQLKKEKWIHNRVRLIVASFLVKDLHIDWKKGEEFFKKYLIDYDEALNIGNWQWAASVGVDPLPIRLFNPILQSKKYDPECVYIKKYLPELESFKCEELHDPLKYRLAGYHEPVVNHYTAVEEFRLKVFRGGA